MKYRPIDHLLINSNKGTADLIIAPGDSVMVSFGNRTMLSVLIHQVDPRQQLCCGIAHTTVADEQKNDLVSENESLMFSYKKIAGVNKAR